MQNDENQNCILPINIHLPGLRQTNKPASEKVKNENVEVVKWIEEFYSLLNLAVFVNIKPLCLGMLVKKI